MALKDILTAISTVGFPIVCCGALYYQSIKNTKVYQDNLATLTKQLQEILDKLDELETKEGE